MGIGMFQIGDIFKELSATSETTNSNAEGDLVLPDFPFLSRLSDVISSAVYEPDEIPSLLAQLLRDARFITAFAHALEHTGGYTPKEAKR
jgi:hypothetical protein